MVRKIRGKIRSTYGNWSVGAVIISAIASLSIIALMFERPTFVVFGNTYAITEGALIPGIIMGFAFWLLAEMFTPPGKGKLDLLVRFIPAFIAGMFVGGIFGLLFHFGRYVLLPIYYGNQAAIFDGVAILVFGMVTIWHAAWLHTKSYVGGKKK